ncbi:hypothetical protein Bca4012_045262 [Brassica carinata]|uniref:Uncharacterized protein n=1 Tax=Brassica carinata TaxID=52824 RepID=A0A8X7QQZ9_BRACI|nr:hypothetical protein Bca52824_057317 [Brassica carinata]
MDMSIAVLRAFISKRKQEHEAMLSKRARSSGKVSEKDASFQWCFLFPTLKRTVSSVFTVIKII